MHLAQWNWHPQPRQLRQFAAIALGALPLVAWWWDAGTLGWSLAGLVMAWAALGLLRPPAIRPLYWALSALALPIGWVLGEVLLAGLGIAWAALGLVRPSAIRPLYWALSALALPIGWVLGEVLLALVYYALFVPLGLAMRLARRDPLQRQFAPEAPTYWQPKKQPAGPASYLRQA